MVLLEKLWDDVVAGPQPERGLSKLRKISTGISSDSKEGGPSRLATIPASPTTPGTPVTPTTPGSGRVKDNVWRSVFHPGSNLNTKGIGSSYFDKPTHTNCPTVYDWLYSGESRSKHR